MSNDRAIKPRGGISDSSPDAVQRQAALLRLSADLAPIINEEDIYPTVVNGLHDTLGYDHVFLYMVDETTGERVVKASMGLPAPIIRVPPGKGLSERPFGW